MAAIKLRTVEGRPLTNAEVDGNFTAINDQLNTAEADVGALDTSITTQVSALETRIAALENAAPPQLRRTPPRKPKSRSRETS